MKLKKVVRKIEEIQLESLYDFSAEKELKKNLKKKKLSLIKKKTFTLPKIEVGDIVKVGVFIEEGKNQRIQPYEGTVISQHLAGLHTTITVRRFFQGVGVERVFPIHSRFVQELKVSRSSIVHKAKLYYLRERIGKATRLKKK